MPTAERGLQQSLERIGYCVDLKSQQGPRLAQWLNEHEDARWTVDFNRVWRRELSGKRPLEAWRVDQQWQDPTSLRNRRRRVERTRQGLL